MLLLFSDFYYKTYVRDPVHRGGSRTPQNGIIGTNGQQPQQQQQRVATAKLPTVPEDEATTAEPTAAR